MVDRTPPPSLPALRQAISSLRQLTPAELDDALAAVDAPDVGGTSGLSDLARWFRVAHPHADFEAFVRDLTESVQD